MEIKDFYKIKRGDKETFNALFNEYYPTLFNYAYNLLENKELAEEIILDVFTHIWINRKKITIKTSIRNYLIISVRNKIFHYWRKKKILTQCLKNIEISDNSTPEQNLIHSDEQKKVNQILQLIPYRSREIFILHKYNGLKYKEIAELLHISVNTVENHIVKALKILRKYYENKKGLSSSDSPSEKR